MQEGRKTMKNPTTAVAQDNGVAKVQLKTNPAFDQDQIASTLKTRGYATVQNVLSKDAVKRYLDEASRLYADEQAGIADGSRLKDADYQMYKGYADHLFNIARKSRVYDELYEHPLVISVLERVFGHKFIMTQTEMRRPKPDPRPGSANVYHRDGRVLVDADFWITVFWPFEKVTINEGPTFVVPESHKKEVDMTGGPPEEVKFLAEPGDLIFMNSNLLHKAGPMLSDKSRWVLIVTYNSWFLKPAVDHTKMLRRSEVETMSPMLRELFGFTSIPPADEKRRMYTCRPWEEIVDELDFPQ
jgi:ectoine hydroxylase-related dioxygenase (phytanoyl-CoA dioxygenase family)